MFTDALLHHHTHISYYSVQRQSRIINDEANRIVYLQIVTKQIYRRRWKVCYTPSLYESETPSLYESEI